MSAKRRDAMYHNLSNRDNQLSVDNPAPVFFDISPDISRVFRPADRIANRQEVPNEEKRDRESHTDPS